MRILAAVLLLSFVAHAGAQGTSDLT